MSLLSPQRRAHCANALLLGPCLSCFRPFLSPEPVVPERKAGFVTRLHTSLWSCSLSRSWSWSWRSNYSWSFSWNFFSQSLLSASWVRSLSYFHKAVTLGWALTLGPFPPKSKFGFVPLPGFTHGCDIRVGLGFGPIRSQATPSLYGIKL